MTRATSSKSQAGLEAWHSEGVEDWKHMARGVYVEERRVKLEVWHVPAERLRWKA